MRAAVNPHRFATVALTRPVAVQVVGRALLMAAVWVAVPLTLLLAFGLSAQARVGAFPQAALSLGAVFALFLDMLWVRVTHRTPGRGRRIVRLALAAAGTGLPVWNVIGAIGLPWPGALLAGVATSGWYGIALGAREMRQRVSSGRVFIQDAEHGRWVREEATRQLASGPPPDVAAWLWINLLASLTPRTGDVPDEGSLLRARSLVLQLLDGGVPEGGPRVALLTESQIVEVVSLGLDVARALEQRRLGASSDQGARFIEDLLDRGRALLPPDPTPPNALWSRLLWVRGERDVGRLMEDAMKLDLLSGSEQLPLYLQRWKDILAVAEESLRFATAVQVPDGVAAVVQTGFFAAQVQATASAWDGFLARLVQLRRLAGSDDETLQIVDSAHASALYERAMAESDAVTRLNWLDRARDAVEDRHRPVVADPDVESRNLIQLGRTWMARFATTGDPEDVERGIPAMFAAMREAGGLLQQVNAANILGNDMREAIRELEGGLALGEPPASGSYGERWRRVAANGYRAVVEAVTSAASTGLLRAEKQAPARLLTQAGSLGAELLLEIEATDEAVVLLEEARLFALNAALDEEALDARLRRVGHADLAQRRADLAAQLLDHEQALTAPGPGASTTLRGQLAEEARRCRTQLRDLTDQAHIEVEWTPMPVDLHLLQEAANGAPLLYLLAGEECGHAVLLCHDAAPVQVRLPSFTLVDLESDEADLADGVLGHANACRRTQAALRRNGDIVPEWQATLAETVDWLRKVVADPLATLLAGLDEVVLVPCGPAAQLPLHAVLAERAAGSARVVRYAGGARALHRRAVSRHETGDPPITDRRLLAVSAPQAAPPGPQAPLTTVAALAAWACARFPGRATPPVAAEGATRSAVAELIPRHDVVHFSCHGVADQDEPLDGGLELTDGRLTIRDILQLRLPTARLAVIAACEGAVSGQALPDELNSLATCLVEVGFPGVIAAQWQVHETAAYYLLVRFYDLWQQQPDAPPAHLFTQAQQWLRTATRADRDSYPAPGRPPLTINADARWAPELDQQPAFPHPEDWAAFAYHGT